MPKEYACKYLCTGIDVGENRIVDSYSANLIGFSAESLMIEWLEAVFNQSIGLHTTDNFKEFLLNKKYTFSKGEKDGVLTLTIADTTTSKYWYELLIYTVN